MKQKNDLFFLIYNQIIALLSRIDFIVFKAINDEVKYNPTKPVSRRELSQKIGYKNRLQNVYLRSLAF